MLLSDLTRRAFLSAAVALFTGLSAHAAPSTNGAANGNGNGGANAGNGNGNGNGGQNANQTANAKVQGSYNVQVRGSLSGEGTAAVGAKSVTISALVKDENGQKGQFTASHLDLSDGRFKGTAKFEGIQVTLAGRIEPPEKDVKSARIVCTFTLADGRHGRIVGYRSS